MTTWWDPTANLTISVGETPTAAKLNKIRDDLSDLDRRTTLALATVATSETTTSATYTNLATVGPTVTTTIGTSGLVLVLVSARLYNSGVNTNRMGFTVSGATTIGADDTRALTITSAVALADARISFCVPVGGLNPGSTTFTAKYMCTGGTATFADRTIFIIPLGS